MKTAFVQILIGILAFQTSFSQVYTGSRSIYIADKSTEKEGLYVTTTIDKKTADRYWQAKLIKLGKYSQTKGQYTLTGAIVPSISPDPITIFSKVGTEKGKTEIFYAINVINEEYINKNHPKFSAAEKILNDFGNFLEGQEVLLAEVKKIHELQKQNEKIISNRSKIESKLRNNLEEKYKILKDIEENRLETEYLKEELDSTRALILVKQKRVKAQDEISSKILPIEDDYERNLQKDLQKEYDKAIRHSEKLTKDIERIQAKKEKLLKKKEVNVEDKDKLINDYKAVEEELMKSVEMIASQRKVLEEVKSKAPEL